MRTKLALLLLAGCVETTTASDSTIDAPRVLTVLSDPAESAPGAAVHFQAVIAGPDAPLRWSVCKTARRPLDNTAVSPECASQAELPWNADTAEVDASIPLDACNIFGSETPAGTAANAPYSSGGYYQPFRVALGEQITVVRQRIQCALPAAPIDIARQFAQQYRINSAPTIMSTSAVIDGATYPLGELPHAREIVLRTQLGEPESYLLYDPRTAALTTAIEQQFSSWFVSAGYVTRESIWHVPADTQEAALWLVARDDRGASTFAKFSVHFTP